VSRGAARLLAVLAVAWVAAVLAAPIALAQGYAVLPAIVYEAAGLICHQRPDRSFRLEGIQLPVCARCFGLYASGAAGAIGAWLRGRPAAGEVLTRRASLALAIAALPTAATVGLEWAHVLSPGNQLRALSALPLGATAGHLFVRALAGRGAPDRCPTQVRYHS
jgi:uncharacterized membrane protein